jgi:hypothetical protein
MLVASQTDKPCPTVGRTTFQTDLFVVTQRYVDYNFFVMFNQHAVD